MTKREAKREAWIAAWRILNGDTPHLEGHGSPPSGEDEERFEKAWQEVVDSIGRMVK